MTLQISRAEARRIALNAQGFGQARPEPGKANLAALRKVVHRLQVVQIDAVNVLARSHYLPGFSRLGPYAPSLLDDLAHRKREMFECNAHAHALVTVDHHPLLRWRMEAQRTWWESTRARVEAERPGYVEQVMAEVRDRGPISFSELSDPARREPVQTKYAASSIAWWRWSDGKIVLGQLAEVGELAIAGRGANFDVLYDLPERVIPAEVLATPTPEPVDAQRELVRRAVVAMGVGIVKDIADYYRLPVATTKAALADLIEAGDVIPATVEGWKEKAFTSATASSKAVRGRALVSPFDSLVWERKRNIRLFDFDLSFEIYVPPAKRRFGYFVLPFLFGEHIVGRVDLKADRARRTLLVPGAFAEPGAATTEVVAALAAELRDMAAWLRLDAIEIGDRGDLAKPLRRALR